MEAGHAVSRLGTSSGASDDDVESAASGAYVL